MKTIPIVFSTDDNYVLPLCVAIQSLINHKKKEEYDIYIFYSELEDKNKNFLLKVVDKKANLQFVCVKDYLKNIDFKAVGHVTIATYYRYFISKILPQYEKVLYLDCDILINDNLNELYNEDVSGYLLAGIKHIYDDVNIESDMFNAGIVLINVNEFNKQKMCENCVEYTKEHQDELKNNDEQVLNILCKDKVKFLSYKYNFQTWYCLHEDLLKKTGIKKVKDIAIIHYSTKPWDDKNAPFADLWWKTAKTLPKNIYLLIEDKYGKGNTKNKLQLDYYKYYFANPINKFFIKIKKKLK